MIKHVHDILADSEEVGLDIASAKDFVDEVIALGNKWTETKTLSNGDFFNEMFVKPSRKIKYEVDEISLTRKQFVRERNVIKLAIIELTQDLHCLDREVTEAITKACDRERALIHQVEEADSNLQRKTQEYERQKIF